MRCAVIFFHSNALSIYKKEWIEQCVDSIRNQSMKEFEIYEIDYLGAGQSLCKIDGHKYHFVSKKLGNHIQAMNFIINKAFKSGCDLVFNTNIDDYFSPKRFEKQLKLIQSGFDLVSSNFHYINDSGIIRNMDMFRHGSIKKNLDRNHNVIAHPCIAISKKFWDLKLRYNEKLVGKEDLDLWQRSIDRCNFYILPDYLLFYRIHANQITKEFKVHQEL